MINSMDYIYGDGLDPKFKSGVKGNKILGYQEMLENKWRLEAQSLSSKDRVNEIVRLKKIEYESKVNEKAGNEMMYKPSPPKSKCPPKQLIRNGVWMGLPSKEVETDVTELVETDVTELVEEMKTKDQLIAKLKSELSILNIRYNALKQECEMDKYELDQYF